MRTNAQPFACTVARGSTSCASFFKLPTRRTIRPDHHLETSPPRSGVRGRAWPRAESTGTSMHDNSTSQASRHWEVGACVRNRERAATNIRQHDQTHNTAAAPTPPPRTLPLRPFIRSEPAWHPWALLLPLHRHIPQRHRRHRRLGRQMPCRWTARQARQRGRAWTRTRMATRPGQREAHGRSQHLLHSTPPKTATQTGWRKCLPLTRPLLPRGQAGCWAVAVRLPHPIASVFPVLRLAQRRPTWPRSPHPHCRRQTVSFPAWI